MRDNTPYTVTLTCDQINAVMDALSRYYNALADENDLNRSRGFVDESGVVVNRDRAIAHTLAAQGTLLNAKVRLLREVAA